MLNYKFGDQNFEYLFNVYFNSNYLFNLGIFLSFGCVAKKKKGKSYCKKGKIIGKTNTPLDVIRET